MKQNRKTKQQLMEELEALRSEIAILRKAEIQPTHTKDELREIQELFRSVTDHMLDAMVIIDWEGSILYANEATFRLVGLERKNTLSGLNIFQFIVPDNHQAVKENLFLIRDGKDAFLSVYKIITRDGGERWVEAIGKKIVYQNRDADLVTIRDVTERRLFEEQLLISEKKFAIAFLSSPAPMVITDPESGEIIDVNRSFDSWSGYSRDELIGHTTIELGLWIEARDRDRFIKELIAKRTVDSWEMRFRTKGGGIRDVLFSARSIELEDTSYILSHIHDITERRQAEDALKERQARLDSIFRAAPTGIGVVSNRILLEVNDRICEMTGYSREELVRKSARMLYPTQEDFNFVGSEKYRQIHERGTGSVETHWRRKDGAIIDIILSSTPIIQGDLSSGVTFTALDITERKQAEESLRKSATQYRSTVDAMADALHVVDSDLHILLMNDAFRQWNRELGLQEETEGKVLLEVFPFLSAEVGKEYEKVFRTGALLVTEDTNTVKGREYITETRKIPVVEGGKVTRVITIIRDITERKSSEKALKESEERYRRITSTITDYIFTVNMEGGRPMRTVHSPACEAVTGYTVEDFNADPYIWFNMVVEEDRERVRDQASRILAGEDVSPIEHRIRRKDGIVHWVSNTPVLHRDTSGALISYDGVLTDITERKMAEEALRDSEERFRGIANNLPGVVYQFYARRNGEMGLYYVSERSQELLGLGSSLQDFFMRFTACVAPEDRERFLSSIQEVVHSVSKWEFEGRFIKPTGEEMYVRGISQPKQLDDEIVFNGVMLDITDRKRAEKALEESEERFRSLIQNSSDIIVILDEKGLLTYQTPSVERILGYQPGYLIGKSPLDLIHPDDIEKVAGDLKEVYQATNPGTPTEFRFRRADGIWIYLEAIGKNLLDFPGINGIVITARDITERKKVEEERIEMERRLLHAQKLESLGVMAGGIAHDFNNLLMAILGNLDLALLDLSPVSRPRPFIDQALIAARRAADLTNHMLAYSGKGRFDLNAFNMSELVEEMARLLKASISKTVTLNLQMARDLKPIMADPGQIQQIVMNLIVNASEAIGDQAGIVTITTGMQECDENYLMKSRLKEKPPAGTYVFLEVKDTGCGMDHQTQERLFDPFFTTKFTGRGLGMAAVLGIVSGHKGAILVESMPGRGTMIRVMFPASGKVKKTSRERKKKTAAVKTDAGKALPSGVVLIVDDEEMVRTLCKSMVERFGYRVLTASDGEEAIMLFREHEHEIVCVILDLTMPKKDGKATFEELRHIRSDVKVIISSGFDEQDVTQRFLGKGLAGIIKKPYQLESIRKELKRVLGD